MGKSNFSQFVKNTKTSIVKHSPEILTGLGIGGLLTTTVLAVKATPKALKLIEEEKEAQQTDKLKPVDTVKVCWKCYIPAALTGAAAIGCLIGAQSVHARRTAALTTAYQISTTALNEYKNKVVEELGKKKEQHIREKIDKDHVDRNPVNQNGIIITNRGNTLCMDGYTNRYFESDIDELAKANNRFNAFLIREGEATLNDLYDELGLDHIDVGYSVGWSLNKLGRELVDLSTSAQMAADGRPCIVVNCNPAPEWGYSGY